jgi:hypothetical protein
MTPAVLLRMAGSTVDITKEREAEAAARRAGLRAQLSIAAAELGTWEYRCGDADRDHGRIGFVRFSAALSSQACPLRAWRMFDFSASEDRDRVRGGLRRAEHTRCRRHP